MTMQNANRHVLSGYALTAGGVAMLVVNGVFTPLLPQSTPQADLFQSQLFFGRQIVAALAVSLLLLGSCGVYLRHSGRMGRLGALAFVIVFFGLVTSFALEWAQAFLMPSIAKIAPDTLDALDAAAGPTLYDVGAISALAMFTLGWILMSIAMLRGGLVGRRGPGFVIAGTLALPVLGAVLPMPWGMIAGSLVLGVGWILLGRDLSVFDRAC